MIENNDEHACLFAVRARRALHSQRLNPKTGGKNIEKSAFI